MTTFNSNDTNTAYKFIWFWRPLNYSVGTRKTVKHCTFAFLAQKSNITVLYCSLQTTLLPEEQVIRAKQCVEFKYKAPTNCVGC